MSKELGDTVFIEMPKVLHAGPAEILRAIQKDERFLNSLKSKVADIIQKVLGTRTWILYDKLFEVGIELLYYMVTTLALRQTLGEEYTGIIQMHNSKQLPQFTVRLLMIVLHCGGPIIVRELINKLEKSLMIGRLSYYLSPELQPLLLNYLPLLKSSSSLLLRVHLALFYVQGSYYHLSKRLFGVKYALVRNWLEGDAAIKKSFRVLGIVVAVNLAISLCYSLHDYMKQKKLNKKKISADLSVDPSKRCSLCLDCRQAPSATPCGHVFCWSCILEWLQSNKVCPLCRHPTSPQQIIPLLNY